MKKQTWISPSRNDGWDVKHENASRVIKHFDKKEDAVAYGRKLSKKQGTELIVQKKDGTISQKDSHGNDPSNIPG